MKSPKLLTSPGAPLTRSPEHGKAKDGGTTATLPRHGHPPKLIGRPRRASELMRVTPEDLQRSTAQAGGSVHRTVNTFALHKSGLYGQEESHCRENIKSQ